MADSTILPGVRARLVAPDGTTTREFYRFFSALSVTASLPGRVDDLTVRVDDLDERVTVLEHGGGAVRTIMGLQSVKVVGPLEDGSVQLALAGDVISAPALSFYGALAEYGKGWQTFSGNFAALDNGDDTQSLDLADLADSGTGTALLKITRDAKGRVSGTSAATTTDLAEGTNLYYTDARADARADARITVAKADSDGVASLVGGKLDPGQLPALAITETFVVNTEAAMLALSAQEGDVAVRTDLSKSFILTAAPASTLANWQELLVPTAGVTSFNGRTGSVTPASGDYTKAQVGLGNVDNTSDADKPVSAAQAAALAAKSTTLAGYGIVDAVSEKGQTTNLNALVGSCVFGFADTATGAPNAGFSYDATGVQWAETGQTTQLVSLLAGKGSQLLIRIDDGSGFSSWSTVLTDLNSGDFATSAQGAKADSAVQPNTSPTLAGTVVITGGSQAGGGHLDLAGGSDYKIRMNSNLFLQASSSNWGFWNDTDGTWELQINMASHDLTARSRMLPRSDNSASCGAASQRWSVVYAATGSINTSDAREKTAVTSLTPAELAAAADLSRAIGTYQWLESVQLKGADARYHAGLTVQQAISIMQAHGLDPMRYGFICYDQWDATSEVWQDEPEERDADGNIVREASRILVQPAREAGDRYSFRHDELLLFIARGFAARLDALETAR